MPDQWTIFSKKIISLSIVVGGRRQRALDVEAEVEDVSILNDVFFAFLPHLPGFLCGLFTAKCDKAVIIDGFSPNKATLEVAMDGARRFRSLGIAVNRPGASLLRTDREEGDQVQQLVAGADDPVQSRLLKA